MSDKVQGIESSLQLCSSGTTLLPQLSLAQLSVLEYEKTQAENKRKGRKFCLHLEDKVKEFVT